MLTTHSVAPEMTNTTVDSDFLHSLNISSDLGDKDVNNALGRLSCYDILLSVHEPVWHFELLRVVDDRNKFLNLFVGKSSRTTVNINLCLLADNVRETFADTNNFSHSKHGLPLSLNVGVQHTQNVLKLRCHLETLHVGGGIYKIDMVSFENDEFLSFALSFIHQ